METAIVKENYATDLLNLFASEKLFLKFVVIATKFLLELFIINKRSNNHSLKASEISKCDTWKKYLFERTIIFAKSNAIIVAFSIQ